ncbi:MAG: hypothetical protein COB78_02280 [Hyphomicrobiales bacterium]|nr:MAG: hypothetical protein COB78_02280 [Hyphomicrobiales bacterium]
MSELAIAIGLVLVLEGLIYSLMPGAMKRMAAELPHIPDSTLRIMGVVVMAVGVFLVWLIKA